jgi:LPXTG-motif cell wall-anchored protein
MRLTDSNKTIYYERKFTMKKFLSIIMVLAMVLSLGVTAFAAENTGSITITNATIGETYKIYKFFDASISKDADGETNAVSYNIATDNQFFDVMFGENGTAADYFVYNENTGSVTKKEGVNDTDLIKYLTDLVKDTTYQTAVDPVVAGADEVKFENLPYGYYLITSSLGTTVTINSNTPDVQVIDKNQKPGSGFDKLIQTGVDADGNPIWGESNSANIADEVIYKITFEATNYDGENKIKYYQIHDEKGDAIWAEFNSFEVYVGGEKLERGYYLSQGGVNTDNWEFLGDWSDIPEAERDRNDAQWYLVHLDYDKFRITIPWLENHTIADVTNADNGSTSYSVNFPENAASKFDSPVTVEIIYKAVVEATAAIGNTTHGNRFNKAHASWTSEHETLSTKPEEVVTYVYGIGLLKDDIATRKNLAGAKFRIYKDADCKDPVYVIPTNIDGVYIVDSYGTAAEDISGIAQETARKLYEAYLEEYLKDENGDAIDQNNLVVSQENGKLAILGLKEGTYYLKEVEAPAGYNALTQPVEFKAGEDIRSFIIFADKDGNVADIQQTDGVHHEISYDLTHTVVHNSKGVVLPSTGGEGTFWLITIGTLMAIGFAVFLITHKKMSIYTD